MRELNNWLANFPDEQSKYCALKLLDRFVYYSEEDIVHLLKYGIEERIFKRYLLEIDLKDDFKLQEDELQEYRKCFYESLYFIKLDTKNPSQSSETMLRYLKMDVGISEENILDSNNLNTKTLRNCRNLVIIDDFIGSGTQLQTFWNHGEVTLDGERILINKLKEKFPDIEMEYFCLICTDEGLENFLYNDSPGIRKDLRITYSEVLTNKFKVFSKESIYFKTQEIENCKNILQELCRKNKIDLLGYESLDYAIAFHHGIPDCSLPLFYRQTASWNYLFRNKKTMSNV
eukprot:TRINITY_DN15271_c0_g1_i1.p1 TRINITY_DN15271_c0_g1~~TRINITY_DN15271_c0_g1_i1.p1  ORF type:complete len:318 (+),score=-26.02 TRINITY_DN15271_c0_g1_i1:92-955(+)